MKNTIGLLAAVLLFMQSCYKDKGNYDIVDYNQIISINSTFTSIVPLGEMMRVQPVIKWKYPERDTLAFDYEWRDQNDKPISDKRFLEYAPPAVGGFSYYLYVTERATKVVSRYVLPVTVSSPYKAGWLVLTGSGNKSDLSFVRRDSKYDANNVLRYSYVDYKNIYGTAGATLGTAPKKLVSEIYADYISDQILLIQGDGETVFLNGDDFSKIKYLKDEFTKGFPPAAQPADFSDAGGANFVLFDNGDVYWKRNATTLGDLHTGSYMDAPMYFQGGGARVSKFIPCELDKAAFVYLFDDLQKRLIGLYTVSGLSEGIGGKLPLVNQTTPPAGFTNLDNLGNHKLVYSSDYADASYFMNILKNNATGQFIYQTYRLTKNGILAINVSDQFQATFAGNGMVSDNTVFHRVRPSSYLFFGEGSRLYFYDVNTKLVTLYHDFGTGTIKKMVSDAVSGELGVALDSGDLYICSLASSVIGTPHPGATGILHHLSGLGTIVDLVWKWGSYYENVFDRYPG